MWIQCFKWLKENWKFLGKKPSVRNDNMPDSSQKGLPRQNSLLHDKSTSILLSNDRLQLVVLQLSPSRATRKKTGRKNGRAKSWGRKEREGAAFSLKPWINPLFGCLEFRKISNNKAR